MSDDEHLSYPIGSIIGKDRVKHRANVGALEFGAEMSRTYQLTQQQITDILDILGRCEGIIDEAGEGTISTAIYAADMLRYLSDAIYTKVRNGGELNFHEYVISRYGLDQVRFDGADGTG